MPEYYTFLIKLEFYRFHFQESIFRLSPFITHKYTYTIKIHLELMHNNQPLIQGFAPLIANYHFL